MTALSLNFNVVPRGVSAVEPEVADELGDCEVVDDSLDDEDDSVEVLDSVLDSVDEEEVSLEVDGALEEVEDEVDELLLVTVVSLLLQAVRPRAPTRTIEPKATRLRKAVLDMVYLPVCFVTELPL